MALSPKQAAFVAAYLQTLNATEAAVAAGYSPKTARNQGSRLLANEDISAAIAEGQQRRAERVEVKSDDVLRVLLRNLEVDIGDAFDTEGNLLPVHKMPDKVRKVISAIEVEELWEGNGKHRERIGNIHKVKFWSKDKALELAMRHLGLLKDKVEHTGAIPIAIIDPYAEPKK